MIESYDIRINGETYGRRDTLEEVIEVLRAAMIVYKFEGSTTFSVERKVWYGLVKEKKV